jgi:membrane protease YdiL (CAAX protease family)
MDKMNPREKIAASIAIIFCFVFPHFGGGILVYPVIVSLVLFAYMKFIAKEGLNDLLFSMKRFEWTAVWIGLVGAFALSAFFRFAWGPLIEMILPAQKIDLSDFNYIKGNTGNYIFILFIAFIVGGIYEEIVFHGFIFTRLEKLFPGKYANPVAFGLTTLIFGAYHFQQGIVGILLTMVAGAVYHILILKFKRNLWYGVFIHTFFDFIGLTMIYLGYS